MTELSLACIEAGRALGLNVTAPFQLCEGTEVFEYDAHVSSIGSPNGLLIAGAFPPSGSVGESDFALSLVDAQYDRYDEELYMALFRHWGWFGVSPPPEWWIEEAG